jgi:hypothetical protein
MAAVHRKLATATQIAAVLSGSAELISVLLLLAG